MSHWSDGYVTDIDYVNYYNANLNPNNLVIPFLMNGLAIPEIKTCCELGFGQGQCIVVHSQATDTEWYGTDFLPNQVLQARNLSQKGGDSHAKVHLYDDSFADFCQRDDLPEFDMIAFHGIWSWISEENRQIILDFIRRKLKIGGVVYASYNVLPAWSQVLPLKQLLTTQYNLTPSHWSMQKRVSQAIAQLDKLLKLAPEYAGRNPHLMSYFEQIKTLDPNYVAHEYLNEHLKPMYFSELAELFGQAKLTFACSANYLEGERELSLTPEQSQYLKDIDDVALRETQKDIFQARTFRSDYWVKGAKKLSLTEVKAHWQEVRVVLSNLPQHIKTTHAKHPNFELKSDVLQAVLNVLSDCKIHRVGDVLDALPEFDSDTIINVLAILAGRRNIDIAQPDEVVAKVKQRCIDFNKVVLEQIFENTGKQFMISPVMGSVMYLNFIDLLYLKAMSENIPPAEQVAWILQYAKQNDKRFIGNEGKELNDQESEAMLKESFEQQMMLQKLVKAWQLI